MARILITGAHGFIGTHLARRLAASGHEVLGVGHGQWPAEAARRSGVAQWVNGEITSTNLRLACAGGAAPERVYHLAGGSAVGVAIANPREDFFRTVASTAELLDWMRLDAPGARLVAVSSAAVYGAGHEGPIAEDARLAPYSPYGHHKAMMEALCRSYADSYGLRYTVARLFSVYGAGLRKQLLWDLCSRLQSGAAPLQLGGSGKELRDWTEVGDVVRALDLVGASEAHAGHTLNIGQGVGHDVRQVATWLVAAWQREAGGDAPALAFSGASRPGDPFSLVADARRLQALDFTWSVTPEQGLAGYVRWFRAQPGQLAQGPQA